MPESDDLAAAAMEWLASVVRTADPTLALQVPSARERAEPRQSRGRRGLEARPGDGEAVGFRSWEGQIGPAKGQ